MYLIKKSTIFDKNIKFTAICIWLKNQLFLIKISNLKFDKHVKFDENFKFEEKIKFEKNLKFEENVNF